MSTASVSAAQNNHSKQAATTPVNPERFLPRHILIERILGAYVDYSRERHPGVKGTALKMARQAAKIMTRVASSFGVTQASIKTSDPLKEALFSLFDAYFDFFKPEFADMPLFLEESEDTSAIQNPLAEITPLVWSTRITRLLAQHPDIFLEPEEEVITFFTSRLAPILKEIIDRGGDRFDFEEGSDTSVKLNVVLLAIQSAISGGGGSSKTGSTGQQPARSTNSKATADAGSEEVFVQETPSSPSLLTVLGFSGSVDFAEEAFTRLRDTVIAIPSLSVLEKLQEAVCGLKAVRDQFSFDYSDKVAINSKIDSLMLLIQKQTTPAAGPLERAIVGAQKKAIETAPMQGSIDTARELLTEITTWLTDLKSNLECYTIDGETLLSAPQKERAIEEKQKQLIGAMSVFLPESSDEAALREAMGNYRKHLGNVAQDAFCLQRVDSLEAELQTLKQAPTLSEQSTAFARRMEEIQAKQQQLYDTISGMLGHIQRYNQRKRALSSFNFSSNIEAPVAVIKAEVEKEAKDIDLLHLVITFLTDNLPAILTSVTDQQKTLLTTLIKSVFASSIILPDGSTIDGKSILKSLEVTLREQTLEEASRDTPTANNSNELSEPRNKSHDTGELDAKQTQEQSS